MASKSLTLKWTGKLLSKNDWLRPAVNKFKKPYLYSNPEYAKFLDCLAWAFKIEGVLFDGAVNVDLQFCVGRDADHHNFTQSVFDAMQRSGCITNDRLIEDIRIRKPFRHGKDEEDWFRIIVSEAK